MNTEQIFALGLGLSSPWFISEIKLTKSSTLGQASRLDIYIDFEKGGRFQTSSGELAPAYDTETRSWQHLNFFEHACFLHARAPRIKLSSGKVETVQCPWARPGSGFTLMFEAYAMLLIENEMPVSSVAETLRVVPNRLWRIFSFWVEKAVDADDLSQVVSIGLDETSSKKGHKYVAVVADADAGRTIFVTEGKDKEVVSKFKDALIAKNGQPESIAQISMDMSPAFIAGVGECFPGAEITFDKFHLVQMVNKALDETRKAERKGNELLKGMKFKVLKKYKKLTEEKQEELNYLLMSYPKLGEAYQLRELFTEMFEIEDPEHAKGYLQFWCEMAMESTIQPFVKLVGSIRAHWFGIVNYFETRTTNALLEGINCKIQLAKRRARGYRNIKNYINMIYFLTGKLKYDYPHYPS
jgi:transposase